MIVPINEHSHWFVAVICYPGLEGKKRMDNDEHIDDTPEDEEKAKQAAENSAKLSAAKKKVMQIGSTSIIPLKSSSSSFLDDDDDKDEAEASDSEMIVEDDSSDNFFLRRLNEKKREEKEKEEKTGPNKSENTGITSVDRSTKATLSTHNPWIQVSRLQKIYHFQHKKLKFTKRTLTFNWFARNGAET